MIREELLRIAQDKRISCTAALALAKRLKLKPVEIGKTANELGIKITDCQLGCFGRHR